MGELLHCEESVLAEALFDAGVLVDDVEIDNYPHEASSPEDLVASQLLAQRIRLAFPTSTKRHGEVALEHYGHDLSVVDLAEKYGVERNTIYTWLRTATAELSLRLGPLWQELRGGLTDQDIDKQKSQQTYSPQEARLIIDHPQVNEAIERRIRELEREALLKGDHSLREKAKNLRGFQRLLEKRAQKRPAN
ncbi:hypothetical protein HN748_01720 [Candidatus Peregrinibacteria bacterium]|jgi:predicted DNA-binding protein YlxM (UPF0122 family)|nr:hypothetical protein [Candidatus Peregrinibacteria bacterium]MBT7484668.1 hypothetical protein [Candidatus Peregrinibacteria bacterium]MBT7702930.1 hypothetical protein [Candidatus Peregrinibacteria bacterium]